MVCEIIGPLVNVLFFLVMADAFPIILLYLRNGNTIAYTLSRTVTLSFTQTVISAIGITLAVPVTSLLASQLVPGETPMMLLTGILLILLVLVCGWQGLTIFFSLGLNFVRDYISARLGGGWV